MRGAQRAAVVAAVAAHADDHSGCDELFHDADLGAVQGMRVGGQAGGRNAEKQQRQSRIAAAPHPPPHLALGLDARKDADVVEQRGDFAGVRENFKGGARDREFDRTRLEVRAVLGTRYWACAAIVSMLRTVRTSTRACDPNATHLGEQLGGRHRRPAAFIADHHLRPQDLPRLVVELAQNQARQKGHHAALARDVGAALGRVAGDHHGADVAVLWRAFFRTRSGCDAWLVG